MVTPKMATKKPKDVPVEKESGKPVNVETANGNEKEKEPKNVDISLCLLCEQKIQVPKCLPCLHSFCESCLTKYVEDIIKHSKGKIEIKCPECNMLVFQTLGKLNGKSYTENLPTGTVCSSLLCGPAVENKECQFNDGCKREAVTWCGYCAHALCHEHTDLHRQLTTMKIFHATSELSEASKLRFPYQKCVHHPKEEMAYFCPRDWSTCCNICGKVQHKTCYFMNRGVMPILDMAPEIKGSHTTKELDPRLDILEEEAEELSEDRQKMLSRLDMQLLRGKENIKAFRQVMDEYLDELEHNLNGELDTKYEKVKRELQEEKAIIDTRLRTVKYYKQMLEAIHTTATNVQAVVELSKLKEQTDNIQSDVQQRKRSLKRTDLAVHPIQDLERTLPKMGSVHVREFSRQIGHWNIRRSKTTLTTLSK